MIANFEQDNGIEGSYLTVKRINCNDSSLFIDIPAGFYIQNQNCKTWIIGWGNQKPYYDAGVENLRSISSIDIPNNKIYLGKLLRGNGFPKMNQQVVFWNTQPSGFKPDDSLPVIDPSLWQGFSGNSVSFGSIAYDSVLCSWVMLFNECDTNKIQIYAALSKNLKNWQPANNGKAVLSSTDFKNCTWAGKTKDGKGNQSPFVSDIIRHKNRWYIFLDGYAANGKRNIGYAISAQTLLGPYTISSKAIVKPGITGSWNDAAVSYAKITHFKNRFLMYYDGCNSLGEEAVGLALSNDLETWNQWKQNPVIVDHLGWRSSVKCSEPNMVESKGDSIFLIVSGVKAFLQPKLSPCCMNKPGNIDDTQLGLYVSTDGGFRFSAHKNNPIFTNNYAQLSENEHMGACFKIIRTDTFNFIFYQAKSSYGGLKYNIMMRKSPSKQPL